MPSLLQIRSVNVDRAVARSRTKLIRAHSKKIVSDALLASAVPIVRKAKQLSPVESGALRKSITAFSPKYTAGGTLTMGIGSDGRVKRKWKGQVRIPVKYIAFVEFGTSKMAPRAFLRRAIRVTKKEARERFVAKLQKGIRKALR